VEQLEVTCYAFESIKRFNIDLAAISERDITLPDGEGNRVINVDIRYLLTLSDQLFHKYQTQYMDKELKVLETTLENAVGEMIDSSLKRQLELWKKDLTLLKKEEKDEFLNSTDLMDTLLNTVFQLEYVLGALQSSKEAVERCKRLSPTTTPGNALNCERTSSRVLEVYKLVSTIFSITYMTPALELANTFSEEYSIESPPNSNFLRIVQAVVGITYVIHSHFVQVITPVVNNFPNDLMIANGLHSQFLSLIETLTLKGIRTRVDYLIDHVQHILQTYYKKNDFAGKVPPSLFPLCLFF
jgi:hypothetical protein